tara:strand:+ start:3015 stop:3215 length:201 start_codon:yes stop_codon:yes gene_type:complete
MPSSKIPPPEEDALRIYYRSEKNVSVPFGWISKDRSMILLDDGKVFSNMRFTSWVLHSHKHREGGN